jgi:hypothetical protein
MNVSGADVLTWIWARLALVFYGVERPKVIFRLNTAKQIYKATAGNRARMWSIQREFLASVLSGA